MRQADLKAAWLDGDTYHADVLAAFDQDGDGSLSSTELRIDTPQKEALIAGRLQALGLDNPRIVGEVQPYSINHNVANGEWAVRDCQTCHSDDSRLSQPVLLASYTPGGVLPEFVADSNALAEGQITQASDGKLYYQPDASAGGMYVLGLSSVNWIDLLGGLMFLGVIGRHRRACQRCAWSTPGATRTPRPRRSRCTCTASTSACGTGCRPSPSSCCSSPA